MGIHFKGAKCLFEGKFYIKAIFPPDFPNSAPEVCFVTPIYHLNVHHTNNSKNYPLGHICMALLNLWNPNIRIKDIIFDILTYFIYANPESPCSGIEIAQLCKRNPQLYEKRVEYFTKKYADPSIPYKEYNSWDFSIPEELKENKN